MPFFDTWSWDDLFLGYFLFISLIAFVLAVYDKIISKHPPRRRIPERILLLISVIGGSLSMFLTMLLIRHKTKHLKFMLGIPLILILQIAAFLYCFFVFLK